MRSALSAALVELALVLPVMVLVAFGAADFNRVYNKAIQLTNAARAGAQYGAQSLAKSTDDAGMQSAATTSITGTSTASSSRACYCEQDAEGSRLSWSCTVATACATNSHLTVFVTVTATGTFTTVTRFPGIPSSVTMSRSATMRVPN